MICSIERTFAFLYKIFQWLKLTLFSTTQGNSIVYSMSLVSQHSLRSLQLSLPATQHLTPTSPKPFFKPFLFNHWFTNLRQQWHQHTDGCWEEQPWHNSVWPPWSSQPSQTTLFYLSPRLTAEDRCSIYFYWVNCPFVSTESICEGKVFNIF